MKNALDTFGTNSCPYWSIYITLASFLWSKSLSAKSSTFAVLPITSASLASGPNFTLLNATGRLISLTLINLLLLSPPTTIVVRETGRAVLSLAVLLSNSVAPKESDHLIPAVPSFFSYTTNTPSEALNDNALDERTIFS